MSSTTKKNEVCNLCGTSSTPLTCKVCKAVHYCCKEHQKEDKTSHQPRCDYLRQRLEWLHKYESELRERVRFVSTMHIVRVHGAVISDHNYDNLSDQEKIYYWDSVMYD